MENQEQIESGEAPAPAFTPTREWIAAYRTQATPALHEKATRYAAVRAEMVAASGAHVDDDYVGDLVADAYEATWTGTLAWDPTRCTLEQHVILAIKCRSRHDYKRVGHRRVSIDPHTRSGVLVAAEAALAERADASDADDELAYEGMQALRTIARDDLDLLRILDAFESYAFTPAEVMAKAKLSERRHRNALRRLARYRKQLSAELLARAQVRNRGRKS